MRDQSLQPMAAIEIGRAKKSPAEAGLSRSNCFAIESRLESAALLD
jgi:hypothetical protein